MRDNIWSLKEWEILFVHKENNFSHKGGKILEEVAQKGSEISVHGGFQDCWTWPLAICCN